jgi:hypothetical protein
MTRDAEDQFVETMSRNAHDVASETDIENVARRMVIFSEGAMPIEEARTYVRAAAPTERSAMHAATHKAAERELFTDVLPEVNFEALAAEADIEPATLNRLTLLNTQRLDTTDAAALHAAISEEENLTLAADLWNQAARRYEQVARFGYASNKNSDVLAALLRDLEKSISNHEFPRRFDELDGPAAKPLADWLARQTVEGEPVWRLGFLPEGPTLKRMTSTGRLVVDRAPVIARDWGDAPVQFSRLRGHGLDTLSNSISKFVDSTTSMQASINRNSSSRPSPRPRRNQARPWGRWRWPPSPSPASRSP